MQLKIKKFLYYFLPIVLFLMSLYCTLNNYIWSDEAFSLNVIRGSYQNVIQSVAYDMHPPLYFITLKFFVETFSKIYSQPIIIAKIFSLIPLVILLIFGFTVIKKNYGLQSSFLFNIFMASMPEMTIYYAEIRMYSFSLMIITMSMVYTLLATKSNENKNWILLTALTILSLYTNYFSAIASVLIYLFLLIHSHFFNKSLIKKFWISSIFIVLSFTPWLIKVVPILTGSAMVKDFWILRPTLTDIVNYFKFPFSLMTYHSISYLLVIIVFVCVLFILNDFVKTKKIELDIVLPVSLFVVYIILCTAISLLLKPIFVLRYIMPVLGCFWLSFAISIPKIKPLKIKYSIIILIIISGIFSNIERIQFETFYDSQYKKMVSIFDKLNMENTVLISDDIKIVTVLYYYFNQNDTYMIEDDLISNIYKGENIVLKDNIKLNEYNNYVVLLGEKNKDKIDKKYIEGFFYLDNIGDLFIFKSFK